MTGEDERWLGEVAAKLQTPTAAELWILFVAGLALLAYIALALVIVEGWQ